MCDQLTLLSEPGSNPDPASEFRWPDWFEARVAARVVNLSTDHGRTVERDDPAFVYVGRNFAGRISMGFGNPFAAGDRHSPVARVAAIRQFWDWSQSPAGAELRRRLPRLAGRTLGCWCAPLPCHAHVLVALSDGFADLVPAALDELARTAFTLAN